MIKILVKNEPKMQPLIFFRFRQIGESAKIPFMSMVSVNDSFITLVVSPSFQKCLQFLIRTFSAFHTDDDDPH